MPTNKKPAKQAQKLDRQSEESDDRIAVAENTAAAPREDKADAIAVPDVKDEQVFSLEGSGSIYRTIVETMKEAAFTVTFDGKILFCNAQMGQIVNRPLEQVIGRPLQDFVAANNRAAAASMLIAAQEQQSVKLRLVLQGSDGTTIPTHASANVIYQPDGPSICVVASELTDLENSTVLIQQLRRHQEALQTANEELAAADEELRLQNEDLRIARNALESEKARYEDLFAAAPDGYVVTDPDGKIKEANRAAVAMFGRASAGINAKFLRIFFAEPDDDFFSLKLAALRKGAKEIPRWEARMKPAGSGGVFWGAITAAGVNDEKGKLAGIRWLIRDITKRKQAEEALRESEERFRSLFEYSLDAIFLAFPGGTIVAANPAACKMFGRTSQEFCQVGRDGIMAPEDPRVRHALEERDRTGRINVELTCVRKNGERFPADITSIIVPGDPPRAFVIMRDISRRKQAEEALRQARDRLAWLARLPEESPNPMVRVSGGGNVLYCNRAAAKLSGWNCEVKGIIPQPLVHLIGKAMDQGQELQEDVEMGGKVYALWITPIVEECYANIYGRDITDRKQAEEKLRLMTEDLKRSNRDLEQFAYIASHDLQEPLRMVSSFLGLLREMYKGKLDSKADQYIDYSCDGADRMSAMIKDLLEYSRAGSKEIKPIPVNFAGILEAAQANLRAAIEESQTVITHDPLPTAIADAPRMTQVFQNLIGNAIKFRSPDRPCQVHVGASQVEGQWLFCVRDNGIGIAPSQTNRVFMLFQRLHTRDKYPGSGIGLAICKKIIERHGGRIWVESTPGTGSTFSFTLPASAQPEANE
jgi:PAS domain S-box-containing protein